MSTKKQTPEENPKLVLLAGLLSTGVRTMHGEESMPPITISAITKLLVKKGIVTPDELRQSFVECVDERDPKLVKDAIKFMEQYGADEGLPNCKKCGKPCEWYGATGGFSVFCEECNKKNAARQRAARKAKK